MDSYDETRDTLSNNRTILENEGIHVNGIISDMVRDFWLTAKESGYDDITDDYLGLHISRCLNRMCRKYGYRKYS